jgi:purine-binding chemotaxis protein CheW
MNKIEIVNDKETNQFVTMTIGNQIFAVSVDYIVDVLATQKINKIPLANKEIIGSLNLRGRIVTALDISILLDMDEKIDLEKNMCIVVEYDNELFSLIVDKVRDVVSIPKDLLMKNPDNLNHLWQEISLGIFPMDKELVVVLDINKLMLSLLDKK